MIVPKFTHIQDLHLLSRVWSMQAALSPVLLSQVPPGELWALELHVPWFMSSPASPPRISVHSFPKINQNTRELVVMVALLPSTPWDLFFNVQEEIEILSLPFSCLSVSLFGYRPEPPQLLIFPLLPQMPYSLFKLATYFASVFSFLFFPPCSSWPMHLPSSCPRSVPYLPLDPLNLSQFSVPFCFSPVVCQALCYKSGRAG